MPIKRAFLLLVAAVFLVIGLSTRASASVTNSCSAVPWAANTNYTLGTVVLYPPNGLYYKVVNVDANGSDGTVPTISTWYWQPTTCNSGSSGGGICGHVTWTSGVSYALGTIVRFPANGNYYKAVHVTANGTDATDPTVSTWYWQSTPCSDNGWHNPVIGGYYPNWTPAPPRLINTPPNYNLIYLFSAVPVGGAPGTTGAVTFSLPGDGNGAATNLVADIRYARTVQGRKIILSVGGAGNNVNFPNRTHSQNFVNSIGSIYRQLGGIDGVDWDNYEGTDSPNTTEMIWISLQLKSLYPGFLITTPPAPWSTVDQSLCQAMVQAGALDYAAPQYYDGPNLADPSYVESSVSQWVSLLGANHVVVGFGINNAPNYMTPAQAVSTWKQVLANSPNLRGAFDWDIFTDQAQGWPFAHDIGPLVY